MQTVNIHEAKIQFSRLVDAAASGEQIAIAKGGNPTARLVPMQQVKVSRRFSRAQSYPRRRGRVHQQCENFGMPPSRLVWVGWMPMSIC
jgi:prevent-host-death family protein